MSNDNTDQPVDALWGDCFGAVWIEAGDGRLRTPQGAEFSRDAVERECGELVPLEEGWADGDWLVSWARPRFRSSSPGRSRLDR